MSISTEQRGSPFSRRLGAGWHSLVPDCGPELRWKSILLEVNQWFLDETSHLIFLLKLPGGRIVDSNRSASTTLGYIASELYEKTIFEILPSSFHYPLSWIAAGSVSPDRNEVIDATFHRKTGPNLPVTIKTREVFSDLAVLMALPIQKPECTEEALKRSGLELPNTTDKLLSETAEKDRLAKQLTELKNELRTVASKLTIVLAEERKKFASEIQDRIEHVLAALDSVPEGPFRSESEER